MISRTILILSAACLLGGCSLVTNFWQGGHADGKTAGETIVFGLTDADKKKREGIASVMMYDGRLEGRSADFYAEVIHDGRFYVFSEWADLQAFRSVWEAPYRFTDIGSGPGGRTVVYVLNGSNKKRKPEALMGRFRALHAPTG